MATVYKSLSKGTSDKMDVDTDGANKGIKRNKQRVLILSSRGVTYRYARTPANFALPDWNLVSNRVANTDTDISSTIWRRCFPTAGKTSSSIPSRSYTN